MQKILTIVSQKIYNFGLGKVGRYYFYISKYLALLKKCLPQNCALKFSLNLFNIKFIGMADVLIGIIAPLLQYFAFFLTIFFNN